MTVGFQAGQQRGERRSEARYPIMMALECRVRGEKLLKNATYFGHSCNLSRKGILFKLFPDDLPVGTRVLIVANWPILQEGKRRLVMVLAAEIIRRGECGMVARIYTRRLCIGQIRNVVPGAPLCSSVVEIGTSEPR